MPRGVVIAVTPGRKKSKDEKEDKEEMSTDWIEGFLRFLNNNLDSEDEQPSIFEKTEENLLKVGYVESCEDHPGGSGNSPVRKNEIILFGVDASQYPEISSGLPCSDSNSKKINFKARRYNVKIVYEIKM
ncbi:hypothetical protein MKJ04_01075 [Pontibacter sp. E15-1]|uniref:hypothetical protein n=1 Tax=Pontibacter sp. E15-1 TaxID=2919918 RepID=UPI001F4F2EF4|nr:hypothetical protein [Pontibacter sp. E15-1]MCJ8163413.1 hypothetical protein [Pontibacter sp. E15-1]